MNHKSVFLLAGLLPFFSTILDADSVVIGASPNDSSIVEAKGATTFGSSVTGVNPWSLALDPETGLVYFSDPTGGRIAYYPLDDPSNVTDLINRPGAVFHGIFLDAPNDDLYFLDSSDDSVNRINLNTLSETQIVSLLSESGLARPNAITYSPELGYIIVTDSGADAVHVIAPEADPSPAIISHASAVAEGAWGVAIHPETQVVYFSSYDHGTIHTIEPVSGATQVVASGLAGPRGLRFDRQDQLYCFEDGLGQVSQIDLSTGVSLSPVYGVASNGRDFIIFDDADKDNDLLDDAWELGFSSSLFTLDADSDDDGDSRSALYELLYNGSPLAADDSSPVKAFTPKQDGTVDLEFEAPTDGYSFQVWLSSDLDQWQQYSNGFGESTQAGTIYSRWTANIDPVPLGLDADKLFVRIIGGAN